MVDEEFIKSLDPDPSVALEQLLQKFEQISRSAFIEGSGWDIDQWESFLDYLAVAQVLKERVGISVDVQPDLIDSDPSSFMHQTANFFTELKKEIIRNSMHSNTSPL